MLPADEARAIAAKFRINKPIEIEPFKGRGNINLETYLVTSGHMAVPFLLQKVNSNVFPMPERVMAGMVASLQAQKAALDSGVAEGEGVEAGGVASAGWQATRSENPRNKKRCENFIR